MKIFEDIDDNELEDSTYNKENEELEDKIHDEKLEETIYSEHSKKSDPIDDENIKHDEPKKIEVINGNGDLTYATINKNYNNQRGLWRNYEVFTFS